MLLAAEMAAGAIAFVFRGELEAFVEENGIILMKNYNESNDDYVKEAWDMMHDTLVSGDNLQCKGGVYVPPVPQKRPCYQLAGFYRRFSSHG